MNWRYYYRTVKGWFWREKPEIRWAVDGEHRELDEIVVDQPRYFHLEMMGDNHYWMAIYLADRRAIHVDIVATKKTEKGLPIVVGSVWTDGPPGMKPVKEVEQGW
jgi:hypothetical protein